jgi:hypothetical protein
MFASAGGGLSKTDHSRVLCRKIDLRARNAERFEPDWNWPTVDSVSQGRKLAHHPLIHGFLAAFVVGSCYVELI